MSWIFWAMLTAVLLGSHQLALKSLSQYFHAAHGFMIYLPMMVFMALPWAYFVSQQGVKIPLNSSAALWAAFLTALTGVFFVACYQTTFQKAPSVALVVLIADVGALIVTSLLAMYFFGETFSVTKIAGMALAILGIIIALRG